MQERFTIDVTSTEIQNTVEEAFEDNDSVFTISDLDDVEWEQDVLDLSDIIVDDEAFTAKSNVALHERRVAVESAQLSVGMGRPLIVMGDDNYLVEGFVRYHVLQEKFETTEIPVYRAIPNDGIDHAQTIVQEKTIQA